ncbi:MAG TPA: CoA protein activase [Firmicutes bacterium]|nr:CoA protein activase [Bacillota bacterium]
MKVTFPHMGNLYIPLRALFENLGLTVIVPPKSSKRTLTLGTRNSPEFACLPLKVNVGNFIEAFELGADAVVMAGGVGPCRFGYYGEVEREILEDLGYNFEMFIIEPPQGRFREVLHELGRLVGRVTASQVIHAVRIAWEKLSSVEALERLAAKVRARELQKGSVTKALAQALKDIDKAETLGEIRTARLDGLSTISGVPQREDYTPLRVGIVGEIYVVLEPFVNLDVERELGEMGVEVERSIYLGDWIGLHVIKDMLRFGRGSLKRVKRLASPYLQHFVGGHGIESVGHSVEYARKGFDGVVHLAPFTCMPEIVAESILPRVSKDLDIPIMSLIFDEHSADTGVVTRLEAFVDLISRRRSRLGNLGKDTGDVSYAGLYRR